MTVLRDALPGRARPKYLNLVAIHLPLAGVVSILHRVSGMLLFLALPGLIYLFGLSVNSPEDFSRAATLAKNPLIAIPLFGLAWGYLHHFCTGVRFLLLDLHIGMSKEAAHQSAIAVMVVSLGLTGLLALKLLGVF